MNGEEGGFGQLDSSVKRLAGLRRNAGPGVPGASRDWQQLEAQAGTILTKRGEVEALTGAGATIAWGSQPCSGNRAILTANPMNIKTKAA